MGKILLTNNKCWNDNLRCIFAENGFKESGKIDEDYHITTYSKINVNTFNLYKNGSNFLACAGTMIYKECIGKEALEKLYNDLQFEDIVSLRKNMYGCYVFIYKYDNDIKIYVDETGIYAFYYFINNSGEFLLTNTYYHIEKVVKQPISLLPYVERLITPCNIKDETMFKNIYRIMGNEELHIDLLNGTITKKRIVLNTYCEEQLELQERVDQILTCTNKIVSLQKKLFKNPHLFMTGGVDSRLILANYMGLEVKPTLVTWYGAPDTLNTKKEDKECVHIIKEKMNLQERSIDVSDNGIVEVNDRMFNLFDKLGEYAIIYSSNEKWHNILLNENVQFADFGYFGEALKEWKGFNGITEESISLECFIETYMKVIGDFLEQERGLVYYKDLKKKLYGEFNEICMLEGFNIGDLSREDCMVLLYYYYFHAHGLMYQYANMFCYAFPIYAQKELVDYINAIPYKFKEHEKLQLCLIKKTYDKLLDIQFFSHCEYVVYDKKSNSLYPHLKASVRKMVMKFIKKSFLGNVLIKNRRKISGNKVTPKCLELLENSETYKKLGFELREETVGHPISILVITQLMLITDRLMENRIDLELR